MALYYIQLSPNLTLALFAKPPVPGRVKTRLCPPLDPAVAARLYAAFVRDTVRKALQLVPRPTLFYADGDAGLREMLGDSAAALAWAPQGGGDLGMRLARVPAPCLILGTDSPHLPTDTLRQAADALIAHDVVIGPADDGGYYLIGLRAPCPALFEDISWSTDQVLTQTLARAQTRGLTTHLLPVWYDIDTIQDLRRLHSDLAAVPPGVSDDCPATRDMLNELARTAQLF